MIGNYQGSSGAERALKLVIEAIVMPPGVDARISWPVLGGGREQGQPLLAYQRRETEYQLGQGNRLLNVTTMPFDIFIWSENENVVFQIMDALESGFNAFPLSNAVFAVRAQMTGVNNANSPNTPTTAVAAELARLDALLGDYSVAAQEQSLAAANHALATVSAMVREIGEADWSIELELLRQVATQLRFSPPYSIAPVTTRDLTAAEVWQLGLAGRVFSVEVQF